MTLEELLVVIAHEFQERHRRGIAKTRLLKLAYLADVFHKRLSLKRLTDAPWIFWHYGPYIMEYPNILTSSAFVVETDKEYENILPAPEWTMPRLTNDEEISIARAMKLADEDFNELLDFVYFDTEPMMNVQQRGDPLDFDCIKPQKEYAVKRYILSKGSQKQIAARMLTLKANINVSK